MPGDDGDVENDINDFRNRFWSLQEEAKGYGLRTIVLMLDDDPLEGAETFHLQHCGVGPVVCAGMLANALHQMVDAE